MKRTILLSLVAGALVAVALLAGRAFYPPSPGPVDLATPTPPPPSDPATVRSRASAGSPVQLTAALTQSHLLRGNGRVHLTVEARAAQLKSKTRFPLHIALVVDRSGSMAGEKLIQARQAAREMIGRLSGEDRLALIAYDSTVDLLLPLSSAGESRAQMLAAVDRIVDQGGTNLGGGLAEGIRELQRLPAEQALRRVILISDGQANEGVTDPRTLGTWAEQARRQAISVSTMGVGLDYNEDLMMALADHGGGSYHYIRDASVLSAIFNSELDGLFTTVAREMVLELRPAPGVEIVRIYGYPEERSGGLVRVPLGDLPSGDRRAAVAELDVPATGLGLLQVTEVRLSYRDAQNDGRAMQEALNLEAVLTDDAALVLRGEDRSAMEQAETVKAAEITHQAMILYEKGQVEQARTMARQAAGDMDKLGRRLRSAQVQKESQILLQLDQEINSAPSASSVQGKGLLKASKARAWKQYR